MCVWKVWAADVCCSAERPPSECQGRRGAAEAQLQKVLWSDPAGWMSGRASGKTSIILTVILMLQLLLAL